MTGRPFAISAPFCERWQTHQDRVDIAAGFEAKQGSPIIDEIEFGIAPAPDKLFFTLGVGEGLVHPAPYDLRKNVEKGFPDRLSELKAAIEFGIIAGFERLSHGCRRV